MYWYMEVMRKYAVFAGRARREEYWMFQLVNIVIFVVLFAAFIPPLIFHSGNLILPLRLLSAFIFFYALALVVPALAVSVRRLHDTNLSGWWVLIGFIPLGGVVLLVFHLLDSNPGPNRYGPNPKVIAAPTYAAGTSQALSTAAAVGVPQQTNQWFLGFCTACGGPMQGGERFCSKCGKAAY